MHSGPGRPQQLQCRMLHDVDRAVRAIGPPPKDLDELSALSELLASKDFYSEVPHNLADYDLSKLRVCKGDVVPKDLVKLVPPDVSCYYRHFKTCIERPASDLERILAEESLPEPYWDPTLRRSRTLRMEFYHELHRLGLISFRRSIKARVAPFFVKKKDGNIRL
eukprot:1406473-Lingulodinium_polyedra.AAC.1